MDQKFEFEDAGRTFFCSVETPRHAGMPPWWWFELDGSNGNTRHAPFAALPTDTKRSVQSRIIAYYAELLAIKARPMHQRNERSGWHKPTPPPAASQALPVPTADVPQEGDLSRPVSAT